jgi:hypothetical protein
MRVALVALSLLLGLAASTRAAGLDLVIHLAPGQNAQSAQAVDSMKLQTAGTVSGRTVSFGDLLPDVPYDVQITLDDGTVLQGVDLTWYSLEPPKENAGPLTDDDREQIRASGRWP